MCARAMGAPCGVYAERVLRTAKTLGHCRRACVTVPRGRRRGREGEDEQYPADEARAWRGRDCERGRGGRARAGGAGDSGSHVSDLQDGYQAAVTLHKPGAARS
jgi:hypothetical protein